MFSYLYVLIPLLHLGELLRPKPLEVNFKQGNKGVCNIYLPVRLLKKYTSIQFVFNYFIIIRKKSEFIIRSHLHGQSYVNSIIISYFLSCTLSFICIIFFGTHLYSHIITLGVYKSVNVSSV